MEEQASLSDNNHSCSYNDCGGPLLSFSDLQPEVHLQILQWLQPCELGACRAVSTDLRARVSQPLVWYHVYCAKYRNSQLTPPPNFEDLLKGTTTTTQENAGGSTDVLLLSDSFPWNDLVVKREQISARVASTPVEVDPDLTLTRRSGMIDLVHSGSENSPQALAVLRIPVADLVLPLMAPARSIAYAEFYVRGGGSIGLIPADYNPPHNRGGWFWGGGSPHVGWISGSIGYHGDNGHIHCGSGWQSHTMGAPTFGYDPDRVQTNNVTNAPVRPDVVGVGVEPDARTVFFTKNGDSVGSIFIDLADRFATDTYCYFAVCIHDPGDVCSVNFGAQRFVFDVEKYSKQPRPDPALRLSHNGRRR